MYILLILFILFLCWPMISRWLKGFMARRMEDAVRKMAGMPSRKEEEKMRKKREKEASSGGGYSSGGRRTRSDGFSDSGMQGGSVIPKEYAEDVEFTETINYSEETVIGGEGATSRREYHESQVSDVQFTEIKDKER